MTEQEQSGSTSAPVKKRTRVASARPTRGAPSATTPARARSSVMTLARAGHSAMTSAWAGSSATCPPMKQSLTPSK